MATKENTAPPKKKKKKIHYPPLNPTHNANRHACRKVVAAWHRRDRRERRKWRRYRKLTTIPTVITLAELLYIIGFQAEYAAVTVYRNLRKMADFLGRELRMLLASLLYPVTSAISTVFEDFTAPIRRFMLGMHNVHAVAEQNRQDLGHVSKSNAAKHIAFGIVRYMPMVRRALTYLLPIGAAAICAFTVRSVVASSFLLEVRADGKVVGYAATEQDFAGAKEQVQERIDTAKAMLASSGDTSTDTNQWNVELSYSLATDATRNGRVLSQNTMADAILTASSDQIAEGYAVYADGNLMAVLSKEDNEHLTQYMSNLKTETEQSAEYQALLADESLENVRTDFYHDIQHGEEQHGVYFIDSMQSYDAALAALTGGVNGSNYDTVGPGDNVVTIARRNGISIQTLERLNPVLMEEETQLQQGDTLQVSEYGNLLSVAQLASVTWEEEIPFSKVKTDTSDLYWGETKTLTEGQNGLKRLTADLEYSDGQVIKQITTTEEVLVEPVTQEILSGVKLKNGMIAQTATGSWVWPVPTYTYISRWMSSYHRGADICAAYGAPVLASDSGVVVTAGWHYSYGNYVVIDHGNGWRTLYGHNSSLLVSAGQSVTKGQQIACIGSTGNSTGNHCHFEMTYNGSLVSARQFFGGM